MPPQAPRELSALTMNGRPVRAEDRTIGVAEVAGFSQGPEAETVGALRQGPSRNGRWTSQTTAWPFLVRDPLMRETENMRAGSEPELRRARAALERLLEADFPGAEAYRQQLEFVTLRRHDSGCAVEVDHSLVAPAQYEARAPGSRLPVEAQGHGKLWIMLHGWQGYLDDLELLDAHVFPEPDTLKVSVG